MMKSFMQNEDGVSMIEYGLLAALIAVVCITTVTNLGSTLKSTFLTINSGLNQANAAATAGSTTAG